MAKNYTMTEAVRIINAGTDMEAITDIGRRYPILLHKVATVAAKAGDAFVDLMNYMPEHLTANKVNTAMKNNAGSDVSEDVEVEDGDENEEVVEKAPKAVKTAKAAKTEKTEASKAGTDYESMSGKELYDILGEAGKRKDCKEKMGGLKKDHMVAYINKYGLGDAVEEAADAEEEVEEADGNEEATESTNPYDGKSAMELFKECKKRGIKAAPKKNAKFYADLLIKADAETSEEIESDDWDEEEVEEEKPVKKAEKKAAPKKATPKKEEADDDDDWDI